MLINSKNVHCLHPKIEVVMTCCLCSSVVWSSVTASSSLFNLLLAGSLAGCWCPAELSQKAKPKETYM